MTIDPTQRALSDELLPLMQNHGIEEEMLARMKDPLWQMRVSMESLRFLIEQHRELARLRSENAGLYQRWRQSKQD